jgi:cytochrome P450 family 135
MATELVPGRTRPGLPPPVRLPVWMQTALFYGARHRVLPRWQRRHGEVFTIHLATAGTAVVLADPEDIRAVFAGPASTFHAGEGNAILGPVMGEHSVLLLDEDAHLAARRRVMPAFHGEAMRGYAGLIEELAAAEVATWPAGRPFALHPRMNALSMEVILRVVFGIGDEPGLAQLRPLLRRVVAVGPLVMLAWLHPRLADHGPWRRYVQTLRATDAVIHTEIGRRRAATDLAGRTDVLSRLLAGPEPVTDQEVRDHLITLLLAGHETTATTLAWACHELVHRPGQLDRARAAADAGDEAYLTAVVKETLRLRPVIYEVARRLNAPVQVAGYRLPKGIVVFPAIGLVQRNPRAYAAPGDFDPGHFLDGQPPPATWIPFGGGIRRCLGAGLSMLEAVTMLRVVLTRVDLRPAGRPEGTRPRNITLVPSRGTRVVATPR